MPRSIKVYQALAEALQARRNCVTVNRPIVGGWEAIWDARIDYLVDNLLPSGSGIDCGTSIDRDACTANKIVLSTSFHHMNDVGMYDGWTEHQIIVRPSFNCIDLAIKGRDRNQIKDYLHEVYMLALTEPFTDWPSDV